ncbi:MAG: SLC13 family permease, partial [Alloprevotella sp.]|nr:SLC13 family permease [Alloprevotella sp.]
MYITFLILALSAIMFAVGKLRSDIVALCALLALLLTGTLTPAEALSGFSNPVVIMMAGLFVVGGGIFQTGLAKMAGSRLMRLAGTSELRMYLLVMLVTGTIGAFVSNTGTVALLLPIVVSMAASAGTDARRLLMPLAFASSMGGMLTLIGTPPNLVIDEALMEAGHPGLRFFTFLPVGLVCLGVGTAILLPLSRRFLSGGKAGMSRERKRGKSPVQLAQEYSLTDDVARCTDPKGANLVGKSIAELGIRQHYGLTVLEIRHNGTPVRILREVAQQVAAPDMRLQEGDTLFLSGPADAAARFIEDFGLQQEDSGRGLEFYDIGIAEIVLMRQSRFVGRMLSDTNFRAKYSINVLGVRRNNEYLRDELPALKLQAGDVLLVQGTWQSIARLQGDEEHWVVLGQPLEEAARVTLDYKA